MPGNSAFLLHGERGDLLHVLRAVVDHLELELRGAADQVLDALEVVGLEAGQLDDDVGALADDGRLGDGQLVDAVADGLDALAHGVVAQLVDVVAVDLAA